MPNPVQAVGHETRIPRGFTVAQLVAASAIQDAESALASIIATLPREVALQVENAAFDLSVAWVQFLGSRHRFTAATAIDEYERARGGGR